MRPRKWVLVVAFFSITLASIFFFLKRSLERNRNLENLLVEAVESSIKGVCSVEKIRIGFFSVYLRNVAISLPLQAFTVRVGDIKVGISFSKLIHSLRNPAVLINQIILIKPQIDFALKRPRIPADSVVKEYFLPQSPQIIRNAPVEKLFVKSGTIRLCDTKGDTVALVEELSGNIRNTAEGMSAVLKGRIGSKSKNFSLQGDLYWAKNKHHISLRLNEANIKKSISFDNVCILNGKINSVVECSFPNDFRLDSIELHGRLDLTRASIIVGRPMYRLDSIEMQLSFERNLCSISRLSGVFRDIPMAAVGECRISGDTIGRFNISLRELTPDSLYGFLPDSILKNLSGRGAVDAVLTLRREGEPEFSISGGGFTAWNMQIEKIHARARFSGTKLHADSVFLKTPLFKANLRGSLDLDSTKGSYNIGFSIASDSLPPAYGLKGSISAKGTAVCLQKGHQPDVDLLFTAAALSYRNIAFGSASLAAKLKNDLLSFQSARIDSVFPAVVSGSVENPLSPFPHAVLYAEVGSHSIKEQLKRMHGMPEIDSAHLNIKASGWINEFNVSAELSLKTRGFSGTVLGRFERRSSTENGINCRIVSKDVRFKNIPISFSGSGKLFDSIIIIDTISGLEGVYGNARVFHTVKPPRIEGVFTYNKKVSSLLRFFPEIHIGVDSGTVNGRTVIAGTFDSLQTISSVRLRNLGDNRLCGFSADLSCITKGNRFTIPPTVIKRDGHTILTLDTISNLNGKLKLQGAFYRLNPRVLLGPLIPANADIETFVDGTFSSSDSGLPIEFSCAAPYLFFKSGRLDSIRCKGAVGREGVKVKRLDFKDEKRLSGVAEGFIPWTFWDKKRVSDDTLYASIRLQGDILAFIEKNIPSPIGGTAKGNADISFYSAGGKLHFTRGEISLPQGILRVKPFVPDDIRNFTFLMKIDSNAVVHTKTSGTIRRCPISIVSEHRIPHGYEPLLIGPVNFGMLQVITPKKGVDLHLPGFMPERENGNIEFRGKKPFDNFTLSGPLEKIRITGTWALRDIEFTYPFLPNKEMDWDFDPFPYVTWDMDVVPGNRNVMYFWDFTGKRNRIIRFLEAYLDPGSVLKVRGRYLDNTFRLYGTIRSYKGAVYYGRVFNRNFDVGVEFIPQKPDKNKEYDNFPFVWGSAEAFSDTSRRDLIKLTCMVTDPITGAVSEKGRLVDGPVPNITFHLSSAFDELPGESELEFYRQAGISFSTVEGAGGAISGIGERLFHSYLLQRWERRIAKKLGLDVMNIETSIVSNYFNNLYNRQFDGLINEYDYLTLANVGVTLGRYFFRDFLLVKARGELIPINMTLTPEYSIGFEFQPSRIFLMDINYGFHRTESTIEHNPMLMLQLRLPIEKLRNMLNF